MFVDLCLRHRKAVAALWGLLIACSLAGLAARAFSGAPLFDNSVGIWFMKDDPGLAAYERYNRDFGAKEWSILLLRTGSIYDPAFLWGLDRLTRRLEGLRHVDKVLSITNTRDSRLDRGGSLEYKAIYPGGEGPVSAAQALAFKGKLLDNPGLEGSLFHRDDPTRTVVLIQNDNLIHATAPYRIRLVDSIQALARGVPGVLGSALVGTTVINAELNRSSQRDVIVFYALVSLFISTAGYFLLGNCRDWSVLMAVVTGSALPPMALIAAVKIPFNMVTVMLPPVLVTLSVCDVVHVINAFHGERAGLDPGRAMRTAVAKIWSPCLWTSVITVVGFLSLAVSSVVPIAQLGVFCALGIALAWVITMSLAPVMLVSFWPAPARAGAPAGDGSKEVGRYTKRLIPLLRGRPRRLWIAIQLALLLAVWGIRSLRVDTDYTKFFGAGTRVTRSYARVKGAGFGQNPLAVVLRFPAGKTFYAGDYFRKLVAFEGALRADPSVVKMLSVTDLIRRIDRALHAGPHPGISGYSQGKIAQLLFLGELAGNDDIGDFATADRNKLQIILMTPYLSSNDLRALEGRIFAAARRTLPGAVAVGVEGTTVLWADMDTQISHTQMDSIYIITAIFLVLMPIVFRSFCYGAIGVLINSLPLAITFGLMGLMGIRIDMATALIGGVAIGSTVDSTIFFINRFKSALDRGLDWDAAVRDALVNVGDGIIMTSLILAGGFFCLSVSSFLPTAHFGALVTASILVALYLDIIIDPIVLEWAGRSAARGRGAVPKGG